MNVRLMIGIFAVALCLPLLAETPSATALLTPFVERGELAGAVALVTDAKGTVSVDCVGWADIEAKRPMTPDTLFWIASESKPMTAVAVMMLVDEGKLALDDPVEKHLPEFRSQMLVAEKSETQTVLKKPARPITICDCLSHVSGLPFKSAAE